MLETISGNIWKDLSSHVASHGKDVLMHATPHFHMDASLHPVVPRLAELLTGNFARLCLAQITVKRRLEA